MAAVGSSSLPKHDITVAHHTHVRTHGQIHGQMGGWMNNGTMEVKQEPCEVLSDKESDHMDVDVQAENKGRRTNLHGTQEDIQRNGFMYVSVLVYVSDL